MAAHLNTTLAINQSDLGPLAARKTLECLERAAPAPPLPKIASLWQFRPAHDIGEAQGLFARVGNIPSETWPFCRYFYATPFRCHIMGGFIVEPDRRADDLGRPIDGQVGQQFAFSKALFHIAVTMLQARTFMHS